MSTAKFFNNNKTTENCFSTDILFDYFDQNITIWRTYVFMTIYFSIIIIGILEH